MLYVVVVFVVVVVDAAAVKTMHALMTCFAIKSLTHSVLLPVTHKVKLISLLTLLSLLSTPTNLKCDKKNFIEQQCC